MIPLLALVACGPAGTPDTLDHLTQRVGCGDVILHAYDDASTARVTVHTPELIAQATLPSTTFTWDLPDPDVTVTLYEGTNVADAACDDVIEGEVVERHVSVAVSGTLTVVMSPGEVPMVDATLDATAFEEDGDTRAEVDGFAWQGITVGWLPG